MSLITNDALLASMGNDLHVALVKRKPIAPLTSRTDGLSIQDAYTVQRHMLSHRIAAGVRVVGKKIGATSEAVQRAVGVAQPDFGLLLADCAYESGDDISFDLLIQPRAEGEIAFFLERPLRGPGITPEAVLQATAFVSPCIEIVDSRIEDWRIKIIDTIADNASCGVFILGRDRIRPGAVDLDKCLMQLSINGQEAARGLGSASLGHPAKAVAWLANTLGEFGETLNPGEPILSGSLGQLVDLQKGNEVNLELSGIGGCKTRFI